VEFTLASHTVGSHGPAGRVEELSGAGDVRRLQRRRRTGPRRTTPLATAPWLPSTPETSAARSMASDVASRTLRSSNGGRPVLIWTESARIEGADNTS
jgi:hypothetical protein